MDVPPPLYSGDMDATSETSYQMRKMKMCLNVLFVNCREMFEGKFQR